MSSLGSVLIVDNDEFTLIELERVLEGAGFRTTTTWDVNEAVRLLNANAYDHIVVGECLSEAGARKLLRCESAGSAQRCVLLSPRSIGVGSDVATVGQITVCKRRADDVLRALCGHNCALAHAA